MEKERVEIRMQVLVTKGQKYWVAICLNHYFAAQGSNIEDALQSLMETQAAYMICNLEQEREPLHGTKAAPDELWELFTESANPVNKNMSVKIPKEFQGQKIYDSLANDVRIIKETAA